jgi:hypothetical protein
VFDAVASIRKALDGRVPLIGFSGSPWTLACYMVEGAGSSDYRLVKSMLYSRPDLMHRLLAVNADSVATYLNAQIDAGAQAVMVFDSWGGVLADGAFQEFSLAYTARVLAGLKRTGADGQPVPRIVFTKGGGLWLDAMRALDCEVLGVDWTVNLAAARAWSPKAADGKAKALQGNIDPNVLFAPPAQIEAEVAKVLQPSASPTPIATPGSDAHLQPGPRHQPVHAARPRGGAGAGGARTIARPARLKLLLRGGTQQRERFPLKRAPLPFVKPKNGIGVPTYAQNPCCSAQDYLRQLLLCSQTNSTSKLLIYIGFELCFFSGQSSGSLDFQGSAACRALLSTKLSTETLDGAKALKNQRLKRFCSKSH